MPRAVGEAKGLSGGAEELLVSGPMYYMYTYMHAYIHSFTHTYIHEHSHVRDKALASNLGRCIDAKAGHDDGAPERPARLVEICPLRFGFQKKHSRDPSI